MAIDAPRPLTSLQASPDALAHGAAVFVLARVFEQGARMREDSKHGLTMPIIVKVARCFPRSMTLTELSERI